MIAILSPVFLVSFLLLKTPLVAGYTSLTPAERFNAPCDDASRARLVLVDSSARNDCRAVAKGTCREAFQVDVMICGSDYGGGSHGATT